MTAALDQLAELARILGVTDRQLRVAGGDRIVAVCGTVGTIRAGSATCLHILFSRPDILDDLARRLLQANGAISRLTNKSFELRRLPAGAEEKAALVALVGLICDRAARLL